MRFLQVHLSIPRGGAHIAVHNLKVGLERIGHRCDVATDDAEKMVLKPYDLIIFNSFSDENSDRYFRCLDSALSPHVISAHDFWPFCRQTNLVRIDSGWMKCDGRECNECGLSKDARPHLGRIIGKHIVCFHDRSADLFKGMGFENVHVIPHGVDTKMFTPSRHSRRGDMRILFSNAWGHKIIKGWSHWESLKTKMGNGHGYEFVECLGEIPHSWMPAFLSSGDVFLFLSLWEETFGLVMLEAMACGVPVISYPVGIAPDVIRHGENGLLVDSSNPDDVVINLEMVKGMPVDEMESMRSAARMSVEGSYSVEAMAERYVALAKEMGWTS